MQLQVHRHYVRQMRLLLQPMRDGVGLLVDGVLTSGPASQTWLLWPDSCSPTSIHTAHAVDPCLEVACRLMVLSATNGRRSGGLSTDPIADNILYLKRSAQMSSHSQVNTTWFTTSRALANNPPWLSLTATVRSRAHEPRGCSSV